MKSNKKSAANTKDYLQIGMDVALATKAVLGKNLITAIQNKGTVGALAFCNARAIPLTDSLAVSMDAGIKRVSDKNRNTENSANESELAYIEQAKLAIEKNGKASPKINEINDKMVGYYPIMTNGMCLQCHGNPQIDINEETLEMIKSKYPKDNATGYLANELRGIWVVTMDK